MYEVRSYYSFWGEPDRRYKKCFSSVKHALEYYWKQDHFDTSHRILRVQGVKEVEIDILHLLKNYDKL